MKLQLAMVFAKDIARMTAFYQEGLGLTVVPEKSSEGCVVFDAEGALFALHAIPAAIARDIEITDPPQERTDTPIKLVFQTADMEGVCARLVNLGAKLFPPRSSGSRDGIDPEGNVFQLKGA
jgi:predicted enzyme related to lactoylglutathione lyase